MQFSYGLTQLIQIHNEFSCIQNIRQVALNTDQASWSELMPLLIKLY